MSTYRQLFMKHIGRTSMAPMMLEIVKAEGVYLYGADGKKYIDLISGVSVSNTGHRHPLVIKAVKEQVDSYLHLMVYGEYIESPQVRYATRLCNLLPPELSSCYFVNSGSEAVEGALKLAKRYTGRNRIITFKNAYHGSTHGALSVQGSEVYKNVFRPLIPGIFLACFNNTEDIDQIDDKTACVIVEPVQAEAGVIYPEGRFLENIRDKCSATGTLLIFDEAQTGFGRLGSMFAFEKFHVIPDILVVAKALGGGMPLGAFISSGEIMSSLTHDPSLGHITTFGGHPVCCAAGLAALEVITGENLIADVRRKSEIIKEQLVHPFIREIRGDGFLIAVELEDEVKTSLAVKQAPEYGIILDYFLFCNTAFRIAPPLTISDDEIRYSCGQIIRLLDNIPEISKIK